MRFLNIIKFFIGFAGVFICAMGICAANDLDDGIAIDDKIAKYDQIEVDTNISFIKMGAKSKSKNENYDIVTGISKNGDVVQGSIILRPGATAGDIILIYEGDNNILIND